MHVFLRQVKLNEGLLEIHNHSQALFIAALQTTTTISIAESSSSTPKPISESLGLSPEPIETSELRSLLPSPSKDEPQIFSQPGFSLCEN